MPSDPVNPEPQKDQRDADKDKFVALPNDLKNAVVAMAVAKKQPMVLSAMDPQRNVVEFTIRSDQVMEEVRYNLSMIKLMDDEGIDPEDRFWCDDCEDGNYFWCDYKQYGDRKSCPDHSAWLKKKESETDTKATTIPLADIKPGSVSSVPPYKPTTPIKTGFQSYQGSYQSSKPLAPVVTNSQSKVPHETFFRCSFCWHWFANEERLASHVVWACPGKDGYTPDTLHTVIKCVCGPQCSTLEDRLVSLKPKEVDEDTTSDPPDTVDEGTEGKEADTTH